MNQQRLWLLVAFVAASLTPIASAQNAAQNVRAEFAGTRATISYELSGDGLFDVVVSAALRNGSQLKMAAVSGDVGPGILAAPIRQIFWDVLTDHPQGFDGDVLFTVTASQVVPEKKSRALMYVIGAIVAGAGGTAALLLGGDPKPKPDLPDTVIPDPPVRPNGN